MASGPQEIQQMLVSYAKQETVDPLKTLGRYIAFGIAGSIFVALGYSFLALGVLRYAQTFDTFSGDWSSMAPYGIALAATVLFLVIILSTLSRAKRSI